MRSIEYLDLGPGPPGAPRRPGGQTVLFLHGAEGGAESWRPQLDGLSPMVRCVAWTMPGYGRSRGLAQTTVPALADAARTLLDELEVEQAVVVGHAMGGFIAQELALSHPERVERLVLVATTATFGRGPGSSYNEEFLEARLAPLETGRRTADLARRVIPALVGPDRPAAVITAAVKQMGTITPAAYKATLQAGTDWDGRDRLPTLSVSTLCLAGAADALAPPAAVAELADLIPGARLELVEGAGHLVPQEQPDEVNRHLRAFLAWM